MFFSKVVLIACLDIIKGKFKRSSNLIFFFFAKMSSFLKNKPHLSFSFKLMELYLSRSIGSIKMQKSNKPLSNFSCRSSLSPETIWNLIFGYFVFKFFIISVINFIALVSPEPIKIFPEISSLLFFNSFSAFSISSITSSALFLKLSLQGWVQFFCFHEKKAFVEVHLQGP